MDLKFNNEKFAVSVDSKDGKLNGTINNEAHSYPYRKISDNIIAIFIDSKYHNLYFAEDEKRIYIGFDGESFVFDKIKDEEKSFDNADNGYNGIRQEVIPPMPGNIVKVLVKIGDIVSEGDPLIIVEAMKMETSLYASIDGKVTEINVEAGNQVDSDQILIIVEKEEIA